MQQGGSLFILPSRQLPPKTPRPGSGSQRITQSSGVCGLQDSVSSGTAGKIRAAEEWVDAGWLLQLPKG